MGPCNQEADITSDGSGFPCSFPAASLQLSRLRSARTSVLPKQRVVGSNPISRSNTDTYIWSAVARAMFLFGFLDHLLSEQSGHGGSSLATPRLDIVQTVTTRWQRAPWP